MTAECRPPEGTADDTYHLLQNDVAAVRLCRWRHGYWMFPGSYWAKTPEEAARGRWCYSHAIDLSPPAAPAAPISDEDLAVVLEAVWMDLPEDDGADWLGAARKARELLQGGTAPVSVTQDAVQPHGYFARVLDVADARPEVRGDKIHLRLMTASGTVTTAIMSEETATRLLAPLSKLLSAPAPTPAAPDPLQQLRDAVVEKARAFQANQTTGDGGYTQMRDLIAAVDALNAAEGPPDPVAELRAAWDYVFEQASEHLPPSAKPRMEAAIAALEAGRGKS